MKYKIHLIGCLLLALVFSTWMLGVDIKRGFIKNPFKKVKADNFLKSMNTGFISDTFFGDIAYVIQSTIAAAPPPKVVFNAETELVCFDTSLPAHLVVYTEKWSTDKPGHSFISLAQGLDTVAYGFYPALNFPQNFAGPGALGNDSGHYYDHAWDLGQISAEQLSEIIELSKAYGKSKYIFLVRNCVDFVVEVMWIKGIDVNNYRVSATPNMDRMIRPYATSSIGYAPIMHMSCIDTEGAEETEMQADRLDSHEEARGGSGYR